MRLIIIVLLTFSLPVSAQVYKWTDAEGNTHFGSQPPPGQQEEVKIREIKTGPMITDGQRRMLESADQKLRSPSRQYESASASDSPNYVCQGVRNRVKNLHDRMDNLTRRGYRQSEKNELEQRIIEAERHRDNICR